KEVEAMRDAWSKAGHAMGDLQATAFALGCVLKDGEPASSERAMAQAGPRAAVMLHRAADEALAGLAPGVTMVSRTRPEMQGYIDLARDFQGCALFAKPSRAPDVREARGEALRERRADQRHLLYGKRGRDQAAHRGDAQRGLHAVHHPARART